MRMATTVKTLGWCLRREKADELCAREPTSLLGIFG
jgi:hypothetical protein